MTRVAIYRDLILPRSETFVRDQVAALTRWTPTFVGNQRVADGLDLRDANVVIPHGNSRMRRMRRRAGFVDHDLVDALRGNTDLVHAHFALDAAEAWPAAQRADLPMLVTLHGYDITTHPTWWRSGRGGLSRMLYPTLLARLFREPRVGFIAVSDYIRQRAIEVGVPSEKIVTRRVGIDVRKFRPSDPPAGVRAPNVLFVGRLVEKKGVRFLIDAMACLRQRVPAATLTVVGDGPLRAQLEEHARQQSIEVDFMGAQDPAGVSRQLARARVLCLPSIVAANGDAEGFGMVLLEAQASGVPVITSARGGATEGLVEGVTGFSFPERGVAELTNALTSVLGDDALANRMSVAASAFVNDAFDIAALTPALESVYDHAATAHRIEFGESK